MSTASDRNLLLGIIALQIDFISRDALIAAMNAWVLNKTTPLSQILQGQGALTESRRLLLEALVEEHLNLHEGDPQKSLAALSPISSVRDHLSRIADPDLQASLPHGTAARIGRDDDPDRTASLPSVGDSTSGGTRFRILRPHAKGGLGEVFVARDTELNRNVALKEIQDQFADDPRHRARFEFEAEVTGGLEHPGIVPVYGLGHTSDGRPFYAMRFIQGDSLKVAIRRFHEADQPPGRDPGERMLALRGLLGRFLDVCDAVAYAHGRGVLHRDLKPGNIMLGRYGQTLVVDWGLAKAVDRTEESASESAAEPPLRPSSGSHLEPTQAGSALGTPAYMSPEQTAGRLDRLGPRSDVYCLGATLYHLLTGHAPFEAEQVGEVHQKVLAGEIRRPRTLNPRIAPALEAICLKAMALKPEDRYERVEALQADLERWLADEPVSAWREPLRVRARRWMRRHRTAVTAAASILIVTTVGLGAVFQRERMNAEQLARARAESDRRLDQTVQAVEALAMGVKLVAAQPNVPEYQGDLAKTYGSLANVQSDTRDSKGAAEFLRMAIAIGVKLVAEQPNERDYQEILATCYISLGAVQSNTGDSKGAAELFRQAITTFSKLVAAQPKVPAYQDGLANSYNGLGVEQHDTGDHTGAADSYRRAIAIRSKLVSARPDVPDYRDGLAKSYSNLSIVQSETGDRTGAAESLPQAIAICSKLVAAQPNVPEYRHGLAGSFSNLSIVQREMGEPKRAEESSRQAVEVQMKLVDAHPDVPGYLSWLGAALDSLGQALEAQDRLVEAERAFHRAIERQRIAFEKTPQVMQYRRFLSNHYGHLARTLRAQARADEAAEVARRQRALWQNNAGEFYNVACELAFCVPIARGEARKRALADEAVTTLRAAVAAGWNDAALTSRDPDLASLHDRDDFRRLLAEMFDRGFPADPFAR